MNITDLLMQMTLQNSWQFPVPSSGTQSQSGVSQNQTSFQDLLEQCGRNQSKTDNRKNAAKQSRTDEKAQQNQPQAGSPTPQNLSEVQDLSAAQNGVLISDLFLSGAEEGLVQQLSGSALLSTADLSAGSIQPAISTAVQSTGDFALQQVVTDETAPAPTDVAQSLSGELQPVMEAQTTPVASDSFGSKMTDTQDDLQQMLSGQSDKAAQSSKEQIAEPIVVEHWQAPVFEEVDATPIQVGDAELDMTQPARQIQLSLSNTLKSALDQGAQTMQIRLSPSNLGTVVAEFTRNPQGALHVVLRTENDQTARLLNEHASTLSLLLQDHTQADVRVEVPQPQQGQSLWQQPDSNGGRQSGQQQQQQQNRSNQPAESFLQRLRLGLVDAEFQAV